MSNDPQPLRPFNKNEPYELTKTNILSPHKLNRVTTNEPKNILSIAPSITTAPSSVTQRRRPRMVPRIFPPNSSITGIINPVSIPGTTAAAPRPRRRIRFVAVDNNIPITYLQELPNGGVLEVTATSNGTILSSRPYESPSPTGGKRRRTKKHHKKPRRTHKRHN